MNPIDLQLAKTNRLIKYAIVAAREAIIENAELIENLNRDQLSEGLRSDGSVLPDYSPVSVLMGKPPGPIRLFDEGDFYEGINLSVFDDTIRFEGEDPKTEMLMSRYGNMILGLTEESKQELINIVKPRIISKLREFMIRL